MVVFLSDVCYYLGVLEQGVLLDTLGEHQAVLAVPGPVQQVLYEVLVILEDPLCNVRYFRL